MVPGILRPMTASSNEGVHVAAGPEQLGAPGNASARASAGPVHAVQGGQTVVLEAGRVRANYWRELWRYRELFAILAWRDFALRHRQSVLGVAWSVLRPL